jgi:hypothetical protein
MLKQKRDNNMKTFTLKTVDHEGKLIEESTLTINEGSILVQNLPEGTTYDIAASCHKLILKGLEESSKLITIFPGTKLQVIEIK